MAMQILVQAQLIISCDMHAVLVNKATSRVTASGNYQRDIAAVL